MNLKNGFVIILTAILALGLVTSSLLGATPGLKPAEGQAGLTREMRNWEYINHDKLGTNYSPQNIINKDNVQHLELKWIYPMHVFPDYPYANQLLANLTSKSESVSSATALVYDDLLERFGETSTVGFPNE